MPPFPISDTAQLAAKMASQVIPRPGNTPASTPAMGAVSRRNTAPTTSTTTKTKKKKTKTAPAQEQSVSISSKRLTELLKLPEQIKSLKIRVSNAERALKRKLSSSTTDDSAK